MHMGEIEEEDSDGEDYAFSDSDHDNDKFDEADDDYDYDSDDGRLEEGDDVDINSQGEIGRTDLDRAIADAPDGSEDSDYDSALSEEDPTSRTRSRRTWRTVYLPRFSASTQCLRRRRRQRSNPYQHRDSTRLPSPRVSSPHTNRHTADRSPQETPTSDPAQGPQDTRTRRKAPRTTAATRLKQPITTD